MDFNKTYGFVGTEMKMYFFIMFKKLKSTLKNCRTYNSAEIDSDHSLFIVNLVMKKQNKTKKDETYNKKNHRNVMTR